MATDKEALQILELSPDLIGMGNLEGFFTRINSAFGRLLGYSDEEFLSRPVLSFVHEGLAHRIAVFSQFSFEDEALTGPPNA